MCIGRNDKSTNDVSGSESVKSSGSVRQMVLNNCTVVFDPDEAGQDSPTSGKRGGES